MKGIKKSLTEEYLYLDFSHQAGGHIFPLHTSVTLFLLSYCDCSLFKVCFVRTKEGTDSSLQRKALSQDVEIQILSKEDLPPIVQSCCLPAVVEQPGNFCRAGLAVVLRHIVQKSYEADPSKKDILELLGFKKTCLKACAEVSLYGLCSIVCYRVVTMCFTAYFKRLLGILSHLPKSNQRLSSPSWLPIFSLLFVKSGVVI